MLIRVRLGIMLVATMFVLSASARADENGLNEQYSQIIRLFNDRKYADCRKEVAKFIAAADKIKSGDPTYKTAQELLKDAREIPAKTYNNSSINAHNSAQAATRAARLDEAVGQWQQAVDDLTELHKLQPEKGTTDVRLAEAKAALSRCQVLVSVFAGKAPDTKLLQAGAHTKPEVLSAFTPGFSLPLLDQARLFSFADVPDNTMLVVQIGTVETASEKLYVAFLRGLKKTHGERLHVLTVLLESPRDRKGLDGLLKSYANVSPVGLDDGGEFRSSVLPNNLRYPAFLVVTRERRSLFVSGGQHDELAVAVAQAVAAEFDRKPKARAHGPIAYYPKAEPVVATRVGGERADSIRFGGKPYLLLITFENQRGSYLKSFAELAKKHSAKVDVAALVHAQSADEVSAFAKANTFPVYWLKADLPACYGPKDYLRLALVSGRGQVLKVLTLSTGEDYGPVLERYVELLTTPGALPSDLDAPSRANLAFRGNGGKIESVSSAVESGSAETLIDGQSDHATWHSRAGERAEIVVSFLGQMPATFDRVVLDNPAGAQDFEVFAGDDGPMGALRSLGKFRLEKRGGLQAFPLPETKAKYVKIQLLSSYDEKKEFGLGEIVVEEAAGAKPTLADRLAASFANGFEDEFAKGRLTSWQQTDFIHARTPPSWSIQGGKLVQPRSPQSGDHRCTAMLHTNTVSGDFQLEATLKGHAHAAGLIFGFRDWDNFDRLLVLEGQSQADGHMECNSIRLERWRDGRSRVLSVHGESFARDLTLRLEIIRQGKQLAAKVQGQVIVNVRDDERPLPGRVGLFTSDSHGYAFEKVRLAPLKAPVDLAEVNPLSSAGGASIIWLSGQGNEREPKTWAFNLLRNPILAPSGYWEVAPKDGRAPEVVFAFRDGKEVTLEELGFALADAKDVGRMSRTRQVEVLVARDSGLQPERFRSIGIFDLEARDGVQAVALKQPIPCRYLMLRLLKNDGATKFTLARMTARLGAPPTDGPRVAADRGQVELEFGTPADGVEKEPNDKPEQASPIADGKTMDGAIRPGEVDFFRLPDPPEKKGRANLRVRLAALPWLRLNATVLDDTGKPLSPALVQSGSGQVALRSLPRLPQPRWVRVEMPNASLSLVIDTSGSMGGREKDVRSAVQEFVQGVSATEEIEAYKFSTKVIPLTPFTNDKKKLAAIPKQISMTGNTALYQALLQAMKSLSGRAGSQAILLLSDGMNTVPGPDFAELCRRLREQPVPIYVVGVGWDLYEFDAASGNTCFDLLRNLTLLTGGRFYFAPTSEQLGGLYRQIADEMRGDTRYRLSAKWEVLERAPELAATAIERGGIQPFAGPAPTAPPELVAIGPSAPVGPLPTGLPPAPVELTEPPPAKPGPIELSRLPLPSPFDLADVGSTGTAPPLLRLPLPGAVELAPDSASPSPVTILPPIAPLPEFGQLTIGYRPPPGAAAAQAAALPVAVRPAFELILDSSGSMEEKVNNEAKFLIARRVMDKLLKAMPDDANVGLRMFGTVLFWKRNQEPLPDVSDKRYDADSELVVGIGKLDDVRRKKMNEWIGWAKPLGKTPLCYSLIQAVKDFPANWKGPKTVVLISDGMETCGGRLEDVTKAYGGADIGLVIHVVGFDVSEPKEQEQLKAIAKIGRGNFYNATNAKELADALKSAVESARYVIHDEQGRAVVAHGSINGKPVDLEAGAYQLSIPGTQVRPVKVRIANGKAVRVSLDENGKLTVPD